MYLGKVQERSAQNQLGWISQIPSTDGGNEVLGHESKNPVIHNRKKMYLCGISKEIIIFHNYIVICIFLPFHFYLKMFCFRAGIISSL